MRRRVTYQDRNSILVKMGFKTYDEYLESDLWSSIRDRVFAEKGRSCCLCGCFASSIHHRGYGEDVLRGLTIKPLMPICRKCHDRVEFRANRRKRTLHEVEGTFNALLTRSKKSKNKPMCQFDNCRNTPKKGYRYCGPCMKNSDSVQKVVDAIQCGKIFRK